MLHVHLIKIQYYHSNMVTYGVELFRAIPPGSDRCKRMERQQ